MLWQFPPDDPAHLKIPGSDEETKSPRTVRGQRDHTAHQKRQCKRFSHFLSISGAKFLCSYYGKPICKAHQKSDDQAAQRTGSPCQAPAHLLSENFPRSWYLPDCTSGAEDFPEIQEVQRTGSAWKVSPLSDLSCQASLSQ